MQESPQGTTGCVSNEEKNADILEKSKDIARLFKYLRQYYLDSVTSIIPLERISAKTEYVENSKYYNKLNIIFEKYKINPERYLRFCLGDIGKTNIRDILDIRCFSMFASSLKEYEQLKKVYDDFNRTANIIADECIGRGIDVEDYLLDLVHRNILAYEYYNGNISKYYLVGISNFGDIYSKLDQMNREELSIIYEATDQLRYTLQESFRIFGNDLAKPISYTRGIITAKLNNKTKTENKENQICVS